MDLSDPFLASGRCVDYREAIGKGNGTVLCAAVFSHMVFSETQRKSTSFLAGYPESAGTFLSSICIFVFSDPSCYMYDSHVYQRHRTAVSGQLS